MNMKYGCPVKTTSGMLSTLNTREIEKGLIAPNMKKMSKIISSYITMQRSITELKQMMLLVQGKLATQ